MSFDGNEEMKAEMVGVSEFLRGERGIEVVGRASFSHTPLSGSLLLCYPQRDWPFAAPTSSRLRFVGDQSYSSNGMTFLVVCPML